jgi:hypothetical protein
MGDALAILGLLAFGPGLLAYVGYLIRQKRWRDSVPLLEAVFDKAVGVEPTPRNRIDHAFMIVQLSLMALVGIIVTGLGLFVVLKDSGILE